MKKFLFFDFVGIILINFSYIQVEVRGEPTVSQTSSPAIIMGLPVVQAPPQASSSVVLPQISNSELKLCQNVRALPISPSLVAPNQKKSWVVSKITRTEQPTLTEYNSNDLNLCNFISYASHCRGLNFIMTNNDGKMATVETYGYSARKKSLVHFVNQMNLADENYLVYQTIKTEKMEYVSSGGTIKPATVPETVKQSQDVSFAIIAMDPNANYAVFQTCDQKVTWAAFSEELVNNQSDMLSLGTYAKEVDKVLLEHGVDTSTMAEIDLSFYDLNSLVMTTMASNSEPLVSKIDMTDIEKGFIKLICKMIT